MITAHDLKKVICKLNGNKLVFGMYQLHTKSNTIRGNLLYQGKVLVSITAGNNSSLVFHLQDEQDASRVSYASEAVLRPDDTIIKLYDAFSDHKSVAEIILAFMELEEQLG